MGARPSLGQRPSEGDRVVITAPLDGYRVLDLSSAAAGPLAAAILADQGADVIKLEPPGGDFMRGIGTMRNGVAAVFSALNRNKRSIAVDLQQPAGRSVLQRLVPTVDVVIHNLRPGVAERLGAGYDDLRPLRPDLVYVAINGWGTSGPAVRDAAYDSIIQAASGFARHQGGDDAPPTFVKNVVCDKSTGIQAAQLATAALLMRERTGVGQRIDVAMLHVALGFLWPDGMQQHAFLDGADGGAAKASPPPVHATADGWIATAAMLDAEFAGLCSVLDAGDLLDDERFASAGPRSRNAAKLWSILAPRIAARKTGELITALRAAGVPCAVVHSLDSIHEDPQIVANDYLVVVDDPQAGPMRTPRPIGQFSHASLRPPSPAPGLGEHTVEVLLEVGFGEHEVAKLLDMGAVR